MNTFDFDLLTIGAGSGGVAASRRAGQYGARVAICEGRRIGGTCVLRGCVPKKLLVYASEFAHHFRDAEGFGWDFPAAPKLDWKRLITRKNAELDRLHGIYCNLLEKSGVTILEGYGQLIDAHTVKVGEQHYRARNILIATGGKPHFPSNIEGIEHAISSDETLDLEELPRRVAIVGGGFIAVEFAGIFASAGAHVELVFRSNAVLRGFDEDIRDHLGQELASQGIKLRASATPTRIEALPGGYRLHFTRDGDSETVDVDRVIFATGRTPNTESLQLAAAGLPDRPGEAICVDRWSQTRVSNIYAVGDVTNRINLTPVAIAEGRAVAETLFNRNPTPIDHTNVPSAVFSQPPVATVGWTEQDARRHGHDVEIFRTQFRPMRNTLSGATSKILMKLVVDKSSRRVLGCHMVGPDAPEIIQGLAIALKCGATKEQFDATIGIHPSAAEEFVTMYQPVSI